MNNEIEMLRAMNAKRRYEVIETDNGEWLAAASDYPGVIGEGPTFEDAACDLFDQCEQTTGRNVRSH